MKSAQLCVPKTLILDLLAPYSGALGNARLITCCEMGCLCGVRGERVVGGWDGRR